MICASSASRHVHNEKHLVSGSVGELGGEAVLGLVTMKEALEDPSRLLLGV